MKSLFLTAFLFCIIVNAKSQQLNIDSLIMSNIIDSKFFELQDIYEKNKDSLTPFMRSFCEFELARAFNKLDESSNVLKDVISKHGHQIPFDWMFDLYGELFSNAIQTLNFDDYKWAFESVNKYLKDNSNNITKKEYDWLKTNLDTVQSIYNNVLLQPHIKINKNAPCTTESILLKESIPVITTEINGVSFNTILDTGFELMLTINKDVASRLGVKIHSSFKGYFNDTLTDISQGFIDSMQIGRVMVYNLLVNILEFPSQLQNLPDSIKNDEEVMQELKEKESLVHLPIVGLPLLKRLGAIIFNFKDNTLLFPCKENLKKSTKHNIFISNNILHTKLEINKINSTIIVDTGNEGFITLPYDFVQKHKAFFPIHNDIIQKTLTIHIHTMNFSDEPDSYLLNPIIKYCNKEIKLNSDEDIEQIMVEKGSFTESIINKHKRDGQLGYTFLKSLGNKVLIDFDNMNIEILE